MTGWKAAWRDVRRPGTVGSTGLIDFVDRSYGGFLARFSPRPGQLATLDLTPRGDGSWSGKLNDGGVETPGHRPPRGPDDPAAGLCPDRSRPGDLGARPAAPRAVAQTPAKGPACSTKGKTGKALKAAKAKCAAAAKKSGKGKATTAKGKKGAKGKATASKGKGRGQGQGATAKKKKR